MHDRMAHPIEEPAMSDRIELHDDPHAEESEQRGITTLIAIICGLIGVGLLIYSLTWALAPHL